MLRRITWVLRLCPELNCAAQGDLRGYQVIVGVKRTRIVIITLGSDDVRSTVSGKARAHQVAAEPPDVSVAVGIDLGPLAETVLKIVGKKDRTLSVPHRVCLPKARPGKIGTASCNVGGGEVVGRRTRLRGGEECRVAPAARTVNTAVALHLHHVSGLGIQTTYVGRRSDAGKCGPGISVVNSGTDHPAYCVISSHGGDILPSSSIINPSAVEFTFISVTGANNVCAIFRQGYP